MTEKTTPSRLPAFVPDGYTLRYRYQSGHHIWWWELADGRRSGEYAHREAAIAAVLEDTVLFDAPTVWKRQEFDKTEAPPDAARARLAPTYTVRKVGARTSDEELAAMVRRARAALDLGPEAMRDAFVQLVDTASAWEASRGAA